MRVVLIADESFATREREMLSRLEVGLADEGAVAVRVIPEGAPSAPSHFVETVRYRPSLPILDRVLSLAVARDLAATRLLGPEGVASADVVHALGDKCWGLAVMLAKRLGASLALDVWSATCIGRALRIASSYTAPKEGETGTEARPRVLLLCPDVAIEERIRDESHQTPRRLTPWGVHMPDESLNAPPRDDATTAFVVGCGRDAQAILRLIDGLSLAAAQLPNLLCFLDSSLAKRHGAVWNRLKSLELLDRVSIIDDIEGRREIALRSDMLLLPEAFGEHRTIVLDAMAQGLSVIAAADPAVDALRDGETAITLEKPSAEQWASAIVRLAAEPSAVLELRESARRFVQEHHLAGAHVRSVLSAYEWLAGGKPLPFAQAQGRVIR